MTNDNTKPKSKASPPRPEDDANKQPRSLFKPAKPEDLDPLDLSYRPPDGDEGDDTSEQPEPELDDFARALYGEYRDYGITTYRELDRLNSAASEVRFGKPRVALFKLKPFAVMRLTDADLVVSMGAISAEERKDHPTKANLLLNSGDAAELKGPHSVDLIDSAIADLYAHFPHFGPALQAIRECANLSITRGAQWLEFRPILISSGPGMGKSTLARALADRMALPVIWLDGSTMTTSVPLIGGDAVFRSSRASTIVEGMINNRIGNPIVVLDEADKIADMSRGARQDPTQALLAFLERGSARRVHDHFLGIDLDFSHLNWVLLANDLNRISPAVRDRCKVIQLPPLTPDHLAAIAASEVERRHLEPELVSALIKACRVGQIKSLRKLHKALDAAQAVRTRPLLH
ncbi:hypothetical protein VW35_00235 [Devosia soli]|uniref:AAA+ ATPase domain-containing protein n=1 Tax=Devosia soli TaxID=361041 RepID=A0A0F5LK53_9HYPH|nr:AAA family ATPase [Devosia soli]KKB82554.1 hypothetical protein VW35_00235 [Devosia soli]